MQELFATLTHAVEGAPALALAAAFVWGVLSVVLSPCHLASIPLIVGFIGRQGRMIPRRAFALSALFAAGILASIAVIGALTAAAGRMMGDIGNAGNYLVAIICFTVGLHLMGVIPLPLPSPGQAGLKHKGLSAALTLGLVFGLALGPCTFAYMAPMLGVVFRLSASRAVYGLALICSYGIGHCLVIAAAGTSATLVQRYLNWNERSNGAMIARMACGALLLLGGAWLIYAAP